MKNKTTYTLIGIATLTILLVLLFLVNKSLAKKGVKLFGKQTVKTPNQYDAATMDFGVDSNKSGVVDIHDPTTINPYTNKDGTTNLNTPGVNAADNSYIGLPVIPNTGNNITFPASNSGLTNLLNNAIN